MNLVFYDIALLVLFVIFSSVFLYVNRKNLSKDGPLFLYRTKWGIRLINYVGKKYQRTLKFLSYVSITLGYILMASMLYLVLQTVYLYLTSPIAKIIKAPPIAPLIPYFPKLFGLQSFFPPFYFIYFIVAILIVATVHEFSHGIFARRYGIKIKSTGFAFLKYFPALFGAFVEQDDKQMVKAKKFEQMSVLSAGVFANVLVTILFYVALFLFFSSTFVASGVIFNTYVYSTVEASEIVSINGVQLDNYSLEKISELANKTGVNNIKTEDESYVGIRDFFISGENTFLQLYDDAPAINAGLKGAITEINGVKIDSIEKLGGELMKYSPGEKVNIKILEEGNYSNFEIVLGKNPAKKDSPWLGIGFYDETGSGFLGKFLGLFPSYKKINIHYEPKNDLSLFIKDFLWWIFIINLLVALFNMLPLGILDGGRFFYLTILSLTKSEKIAKKSFSFVTYFLLFLLVVLMVKWVFGFF
jgi:membrane-associated protease RseP (regulator of RpoE activity)